MKQKRGCFGLFIDVLLTCCTGGLWLVYLFIRYLRNKAEYNDIACAVINQEVEITEEKAMEILKKEYGCPVKVIQKNCKTCYYHERDIDEYPCNNCDFVEYDAWKKMEDSDED